MKLLSRGLPLGAWVFLLLFSSCSKNVTTESDPNRILQGRGRWEETKIFTDTDGSKVELRYVIVFRSPNIYRWEEFGTRDAEDDPNLSRTEEGTYTVEENQITFSPSGGSPWTVTFEILSGSGDLKIVMPNGDELVFEFATSPISS